MAVGNASLAIERPLFGRFIFFFEKCEGGFERLDFVRKHANGVPGEYSVRFVGGMIRQGLDVW